MTGPGALRLALAMAVFGHHLTSIAIGTAAVDVFFVLSGFWISRMWAERYSEASTPYATYMASRLWRLLPVFLLVNTLAIASATFLGRSIAVTPHDVVSNLMIFGYASLPFRPLGPAWSLDIELQFYVIAPALIWLAGRSALLTGATAVLVSCAAMALGWHASVAPFLIFFMTGILAERSRWKPSTAAATVPFAVGVVALLALIVSPWRGMLLGGSHAGPLFAYNELVNIALALCVAPYAVWTTSRRGGGLDPAFADLSYVVYLLHWITVEWLDAHAAHLPIAERAVVTALGVLVTLGVAAGVWAAFDRPINRARARWVRNRGCPRALAVEAYSATGEGGMALPRRAAVRPVSDY